MKNLSWHSNLEHKAIVRCRIWLLFLSNCQSSSWHIHILFNVNLNKLVCTTYWQQQLLHVVKLNICAHLRGVGRGDHVFLNNGLTAVAVANEEGLIAWRLN